MGKYYNPDIHHRRSIRKKDHNYADVGFYSVTLICHNRACLFGRVENSKMILSDAGIVAEKCWLEIPDHFPHVILHRYIIMPNHIHGIIEITKMVGANNHSPYADVNSPDTNNHSPGAKNFSPQTPQTPFRSPSKTIGSIVRGFKIGVTKWIRANTNIHDVWQRDYFEHIIRNDASYQRNTNYIINNPAKWKEDKFFKK